MLVPTYQTIVQTLKDLSFENKGYYGDPEFISFKRLNSEYNFIVTKSREFYDKFVEASNIAKQLNLLNKQDRINLFKIVMRAKRE